MNIAQQQTRQYATTTAGSVSLGTPVERRTEIEEELNRLVNTIDMADCAFSDLTNRLHSVRADEPPTADNKVSAVEVSPSTQVGRQLREMSERVEMMCGRMRYQLRTIQL
jgi:hypothetical protein